MAISGISSYKISTVNLTLPYISDTVKLKYHFFSVSLKYNLSAEINSNCFDKYT